MFRNKLFTLSDRACVKQNFVGIFFSFGDNIIINKKVPILKYTRESKHKKRKIKKPRKLTWDYISAQVDILAAVKVKIIYGFWLGFWIQSRHFVLFQYETKEKFEHVHVTRVWILMSKDSDCPKLTKAKEIFEQKMWDELLIWWKFWWF